MTVRKLGAAQGGSNVDGAHWAFAGGQVKSLLALLSYLGTGENRERYLGVKVPVTTCGREISKGHGPSRLAWRIASPIEPVCEPVVIAERSR